jgi:cell division protein FtsW (lipid II flippase)
MPFLMALTTFLMSARINGVSAEDMFNGCGTSASGGSQVNTALGCIPVQMGDFIQWLLPKLFGVVGGISFLLMVYGFILVTTSSGDPKKVEAAKETITSAITGLLISIFSLFLLRLIAVNILHIPGIN